MGCEKRRRNIPLFRARISACRDDSGDGWLGMKNEWPDEL